MGQSTLRTSRTLKTNDKTRCDHNERVLWTLVHNLEANDSSKELGENMNLKHIQIISGIMAPISLFLSGFIDYYVRYREASSTLLSAEEGVNVIEDPWPWFSYNWEHLVDMFLILAIIFFIVFIIVSFMIRNNKTPNSDDQQNETLPESDD